jgi:hypothetical protein
LRSPEDAKVGIAKRHPLKVEIAKRHPYLPGIAKRNHSPSIPLPRPHFCISRR